MLLGQSGQGLGLGERAVDNHQLGGLFGQQRQQSATCGTARTQNQHPPTFQRTRQVVQQIAHQAHAIKIFGIDLATFELHGIDGTGHLRTGREIGGIGKGVQLERRRHIHATATRCAKRVHHLGKAAQRGQQLGVFDVLPSHLGESGVDERRLALLNGVADDGVTVCHEKRFRLSGL